MKSTAVSIIRSAGNLLLMLILVTTAAGRKPAPDSNTTVKSVMERVIWELYKTKSPDQLMNLTQEQVMPLFTPADLKVLAEKHWMFTVNVPARVSVMVNSEQKRKPFWLETRGFRKTNLTMKNRQTVYEIWQKEFAPGLVGLGVNGFENGLALHYFVSIAPAHVSDKLIVKDFQPIDQETGVLEDGASTYRDWDELVLEQVPESMKGEILLQTTRGRASESHLAGAFRSTTYPSSAKPDQFVLTWSDDSATSMDVQWRTNAGTDERILRCREAGTGKEFTVSAEKVTLEDRMLTNDRFTCHYTAALRRLKPGTRYQYSVGKEMDWDQAHSFTTAAKDSSFSFLWFGDTHYSGAFGEILKKAASSHPDAAFFSIAGDLVSDGLNRNQWDALFEYAKESSMTIPFMSIPGNHDNRAGLGAKLFRDLFSYPLNGPAGVPKEQTYAFSYKNALFLMIDATSPIDAQTAWIENQLSKSTATWKIAMFHFAPYNWEEPYLDIQKAWVPLFDKYHVDMVYGGHLHYYMRSAPMKGGKTVPTEKDGTVYVISVGIPSSNNHMTDEPYALVRNGSGHLYQYVRTSKTKLYFESVNMKGAIVDSFTIRK